MEPLGFIPLNNDSAIVHFLHGIDRYEGRGKFE
jgi:hypothetical protein